MNSAIKLLQEFTAIVSQGLPEPVRRFLVEHPEVASRKDVLVDRLYDAAGKNHVAVMEVLTEFGADINAPKLPKDPPEGAILRAARTGAVMSIAWLLDRGANLNVEVNGVIRCFPLSFAVMEGHFDAVKLLVERGADINAAWAGQNALSTARTSRRKEIEEYLLSKGAREPIQTSSFAGSRHEEALQEHVERFIGRISHLSLQEIVPSHPSIAIDVVRLDDRIVLLTRGMSDVVMNVPAGQEAFSRAELCISLPPDWKIESLADPAYVWPINWLRKIAVYPHVNQTWLGGAAAIIANGEPPSPLAPNTRLSCLLLHGAADEFSRAKLSDGTPIQYYTIWPLYSEERDLERTEGIPKLLALLRQNGIGAVVDVRRANVAHTAQ